MNARTKYIIGALIIDLIVSGLLLAFVGGSALSFAIPTISLSEVTPLAGGADWLGAILAVLTSILNLLIIIVNILIMVIQLAAFSIPGVTNDIIVWFFRILDVGIILCLIPWG
jgi:hypothetical protein